MSKQWDSPYSVQGAKRKGNNGVKGSKEERKKVVRSYVRVMTRYDRLPSCSSITLTHLPSYANSVQALYFCSPFRDLVIQSTDISAPPVPHFAPRPTHPQTPATSATVLRRKSKRGKLNRPSTRTSLTPLIPSTSPTLFSALRSLYV